MSSESQTNTIAGDGTVVVAATRISNSTGMNIVEDRLKEAALALQQEKQQKTTEADRVADQAKRLRAQSKRLLKEATVLESQSKRLRTDAAEASRLHGSLQFEALCRGLRRNDASITQVTNTNDFPVGYAQSLGQALHQNTHVSTLDIHLDNLFSFFDVEHEADTIRQGKIRAHAAPLVGWIEASNTLRFVTIRRSLTCGRGGNDMAECLAEACFRSQSVESLRFEDDIGVPANVFRCIRTPKRLTALQVTLLENGSSTQAMRMIQGAFRFLVSLKVLHVNTSNNDLAESILSGLVLGLCQLKELTMHGFGPAQPALWSHIAELLHASPTYPLESLTLGHFALDGPSMQLLIRGLKGHVQSTTLTSVLQLAFYSCDMYEDAKRLLLEFMHARDAPKTESALRVLDLGRGDDEENSLSAVDVVSMLSLQSDDPNHDTQESTTADMGETKERCCYHPTIGSRIHTLAVSPVQGCFPGLLPLLADTADRIRLTTLNVTALDQQDVRDLARCISAITSLRELDVEEVNGSLRPILAALKENGNIHSVSLEDGTDVELKLAHAYCERNQFLDGLLLEATRPVSSSDNDDGEIGVEEHDGTSKSTSFGPTLLQTSNQIPGSRTSTMIGLFMRLCDSIGRP